MAARLVVGAPEALEAVGATPRHQILMVAWEEQALQQARAATQELSPFRLDLVVILM
jgi:hypothetical protein